MNNEGSWVSDRDEELVLHLQEFGFLTAKQIADLFFSSERRCNERLVKLLARGFVKQLRHVHDGAEVMDTEERGPDRIFIAARHGLKTVGVWSPGAGDKLDNTLFTVTRALLANDVLFAWQPPASPESNRKGGNDPSLSTEFTHGRQGILRARRECAAPPWSNQTPFIDAFAVFERRDTGDQFSVFVQVVPASMQPMYVPTHVVLDHRDLVRAWEQRPELFAEYPLPSAALYVCENAEQVPYLRRDLNVGRAAVDFPRLITTKDQAVRQPVSRTTWMDARGTTGTMGRLLGWDRDQVAEAS